MRQTVVTILPPIATTPVQLWSFQSRAVLDALAAEEVVHARPPGAHWAPAYRWMAEQMAATSPRLACTFPVWAWHSCGGWQQPPDGARMRSLLSEAELEAGVVLLELSVPRTLVFLTAYGPWNAILNRFMDARAAGAARVPTITPAQRTRLVSVRRRGVWGG
ncbi:MAG TPA: DUF3841 domain-containing protein, partial [Phycisphaerales bacterium]|nr:DUF3841 domain-containing protein [Phycisphaerales bacterium]